MKKPRVSRDSFGTLRSSILCTAREQAGNVLGAFVDKHETPIADSDPPLPLHGTKVAKHTNSFRTQEITDFTAALDPVDTPSALTISPTAVKQLAQ